jgi:uncharacterized protein
MNIKLIKRHIFNELKDHLDKKEISLIIGPRQVGKTTIMLALKEHLESKKLKTLFLSLDFENDKKFFSSQENLINKLSLEFGDEKGYVFLDEIQRKEDAGLFLKGIYDRNLPYKFIISGSGSVELKEKVHESLAGRKLIFEMRPISFFEFVNFKTDYRYENKLDDYFSLEYERGINFLEEYMNFGGYPRVILEKTLADKIKIIDEIYKSYIEKDISYLLKIEKLDVFSSLLKILASQTGKLLNYSELSHTLGVSLPTVKNYIWYMEKTFILERMSPFFRNLRKEITKSPVVYFYDLGLRNYMLGRFGQVSGQDEFGFLFQNLMFNKLKESARFSGIKINFWRTKEKAEVDFIIDKGKEIIPVEVKYKELKNFAVERSLRSFVEKYNPKTAIIINKKPQHKLFIGSTEVEFIPYYFELKKLLNK